MDVSTRVQYYRRILSEPQVTISTDQVESPQCFLVAPAALGSVGGPSIEALAEYCMAAVLFLGRTSRLGWLSMSLIVVIYLL